MYKNVSKNQQIAADYLNWRSLQNGRVDITPEQQKNDLKTAIRQLTKRISSTPKGSPERRKMGLELQRLQDEVRLIYIPTPRPELASFFMDVVRRNVPLAQFRLWREEARNLHDEWKEKPNINNTEGVKADGK